MVASVTVVLAENGLQSFSLDQAEVISYAAQRQDSSMSRSLQLRERCSGECEMKGGAAHEYLQCRESGR